MKKNVCILLSVMIWCTFVFTASTEDMFSLPELNIELVKNGDFSKGTENWTIFRGGWTDNAYACIISDPLSPSNKCVKITDFKGADGKVSNPWIKQEFSVIPGAKYILTADFYSDKSKNEIAPENGSALIKLEFFNENSGESKLGSYQTTDKSWMHISNEIEVPPTASSMRILLRQQGVGYMYFDNISLKMTEMPSAVHLETDQVFYYSDHTAPILVSATLNTVAYPLLAGKKVDFFLKKNGVIVAEQRSVLAQSKTASCSFAISHLKEKQSEYNIEASVQGYTDSVCTAVHKIYKYDRPKALDANGIYYKMVKNKNTGELEKTNTVIRPVFAYRYRNYQFELGVPNGIIVAQLAMPTKKDGTYYDINETINRLQVALDNAYESGAMCMIALYRNGKPAGNDANYSVTEQVVKAFCNHEALFAWMVMDETFTHFANPHEDLRKSYTLIRNNDPNHPVYLCEASSRLKEAGRYADILCVDPYPASYEDVYDKNPNSPHTSAAVFPGERVAEAVKAVEGNKPVYALLQAFRWDDSHPDYFPTGHEMRNMLYQSLLAGASGVGYFKFDNADGTLDLDQTPLWSYITDFSKYEQQDAFDAFVYKKYPIISDVRTNDYWAVSFKKNDILHFVLLNRLKAEQTISVSFANYEGNTANAIKFSSVCLAGSDDLPSSASSTLTFKLPPSGAAVYKLTPSVPLKSFDISLYINMAKMTPISTEMTIKADVYNNANAPLQGILAGYLSDKNSDKRIELDRLFSVFKTNENNHFITSLPLDFSYKLKLFLWNSTSRMMPLCVAEVSQ